MKKRKRTKTRKSSKETIKRFLREILQAQEKGEFIINIPFDKDGNLHIFIKKIALIGNPITPQFQKVLLAIAWGILEGKTMEDIKDGGGKDYKEEIKKYLPDLLEIQKNEGKYFFSLFLDENADISLSIYGQESVFPPLPDSKDMDMLRNMILVAFLADKRKNFMPFLESEIAKQHQ